MVHGSRRHDADPERGAGSLVRRSLPVPALATDNKSVSVRGAVRGLMFVAVIS